jgi:predicted metal-dependent phosphoesterase TrpH
MFDLHCHTNASDGILTPAELVARAALARIDGIAVTDHDTTSGVAGAIEAASGTAVRIIAGIELSTRLNERNIHVLGYFLRPDEPRLLTEIDRIRDDRRSRAEGIVVRLGELGYEITMDDVLAQAPGARLIARPHIARALVEKGYIESVRDAFTPELIADDGAADVPKKAFSPVEAVDVIRSSGGAAVLAHPAVGHHDGVAGSVPYELIEELARNGLAGIEVDHPDHPPLVRDKLRIAAEEFDLVATGGSDFHGEAGHVIGTCWTPAEALDRLESRKAN